jgi:hypothetical protein
MHSPLKLFHHNDFDLLWISKISSDVLESIIFCEFFCQNVNFFGGYDPRNGIF